MVTKREKELIPQEIIESRIYLIRCKKVMLDRDLAKLYGVKTKVLNQAVKRNSKRFPEDFMFQLTKIEMENWKSQFVTSDKDKMGLRKMVHAFTEQGVAMLSGILNSNRAIHVNIQIMRTFTKLREILLSNKELREKIESLENKYDHQFKVVFDAIRKLIEPPKIEKKISVFDRKEVSNMKYAFSMNLNDFSVETKPLGINEKYIHMNEKEVACQLKIVEKQFRKMGGQTAKDLGAEHLIDNPLSPRERLEYLQDIINYELNLRREKIL